jgi:hypothetical protein
MSSYEKIDLVVQGPYTDFTNYVVDSYLNIPFINKIIISCWDEDKTPRRKRKVKVVKNQYPISPGTDNKNLQIVSSLNGLRECESNYAIKVRSDQRFTYESMMKMYEFFIENDQKTISHQYDHTKPYGKIFVAGFYPTLLFSVRDHLFWGHTDDLIELFSIPIEKNSLIDYIKVPKERLGNYTNRFVRTETYLGAHYCANFSEEINLFLLNPYEYLFDGAINWNHSKQISDNLMPLVFKSFPRSSINLEWVNWRPQGFHFDFDSFLSLSSWHEDGF